eukprot:2903692-Amphidinium_carterae.2
MGMLQGTKPASISYYDLGDFSTTAGLACLFCFLAVRNALTSWFSNGRAQSVAGFPFGASDPHVALAIEDPFGSLLQSHYIIPPQRRFVQKQLHKLSRPKP